MPQTASINSSPERLKARSRLARKAQLAASNPDPIAAEAVVEARRAYNFVTAADYIRRVVDEAPPLTPDQRDRLAVLLRGGGDVTP
jgi:hypothetical protein